MCIHTLDAPDRNHPRYLFGPQLFSRKRFNGHANTDPYVFGNCFRYCVCQQPSRPSLKRLAPGSIMLFGSHRDDEFVLDTVFVVKAAQPYSRTNYRKLDVPEDYRLAALAPIMTGADCGTSEEFTLYNGATPFEDDDVHGMFSFFPCVVAEYDAKVGFPRPSIRLHRFINPRHRQGIKSTQLESLDQAKSLWEAVAEQVCNQGLLLGVNAVTPLVEKR